MGPTHTSDRGGSLFGVGAPGLDGRDPVAEGVRLNQTGLFAVDVVDLVGAGFTFFRSFSCRSQRALSRAKRAVRSTSFHFASMAGGAAKMCAVRFRMNRQGVLKQPPMTTHFGGGLPERGAFLTRHGVSCSSRYSGYSNPRGGRARWDLNPRQPD